MNVISHVELSKVGPRPFDRARFVDALFAAAPITALCIELYVFSRVQDIWLDEATQLSGVSLRFWEMLQWLAGTGPDQLDVPRDRMPPVSYILDWLWLHLYGSSEIGFRLFHSAFVIAGVVCLAAVARRELGRSAMIASLGFLVLSPKLIQAAVEIRAYPVFFALTCLQTAIFLHLVAFRTRPDRKLLALFAAVCLLAIYTHFYGVVSSCAFFLALGISFVRRFAALAEIIVAFVAVAVGSLAIIPFVSAATQVPLFVPTTATGAAIADQMPIVQYVVYLLKLAGDSPNMVSVPAAILFFGGTAALLSAGSFAAVIRARSGGVKPVDWLIVVVLAGVLATAMASLFVRTFDVLKESYSLWLFAPVSLLVGAGASAVTGLRIWDVGGRKMAASALLVGAGASTYLFFDHASMFVHGPNRFIGGLYDKAAGRKAIVYEPGAAWGWSYIPLQYSHHGDVIQYLASDGGGVVQVGGRDIEPTVREIGATVAPYRVLLLTEIRLRTYRDLRQCQNQSGACPAFAAHGVEDALIRTGNWRKAGTERSFGLWDCQVTILERLHG